MFALLIDIDGTLLETLDAILEAMNLALAELHEPPLQSEELRPLIGMPVQRQMKLLRGMEGPVVEKLTDRYYEHFRAIIDRGVRLYPGVPTTLESLAGRRIATVSTRRRDEARHMLRVANIERYFTAIVGGDEVSRPKPHPDLPRFAANALRVPPSQAVVVGDSLVDIEAGRAAGTWTVAATYGYGELATLREARPHAEIARFSDLPRALADLEGEGRHAQ